MSRRWLPILLAFLSCFSSMACIGAETIDLQGAGATFPAPVYKRWFQEFYHQHEDIRVNYQAIGSGAGIRQFSEDLVTFGASDAAMSDKDISQAVAKNPKREGVLMLPMTAGSLAICYHLPDDVPSLKLSRQVYLDIFLNKIKVWNDPAIASLNPGVALPKLDITVVRRADGSGTTYAFTNHLSAISKDWKDHVGVGKSVSWPKSIGGKGNAGVAALIQQTPGSIGYLEYGYAELTKLPGDRTLPMAQLQNKAGNFVLPTPESGKSALDGADLPANMRLFIPDPGGAQDYPIVTYTWLLCWKNYTTEPAQADALKRVIRYAMTPRAQEIAAELGYIPLPPKVIAQVLAAVEQIKP